MAEHRITIRIDADIKAACRPTDALWDTIATLLDAFSAEEYANYFKSAGYKA